jgi:MOSC domain-containing protein YiiM
LPTDTQIRCGPEALVRITGLRNPCRQIDDFRPGLRKSVTGRSSLGEPVFAGGVMGVVVTTGTVCAGDPLTVVLPEGPGRPLERV